MKRFVLAASCLALALPGFAKETADHLTTGCAFYNKGQYTQALPYLQDAVSKKPRDWQGHYYLGHTYLSLGQRPEALEQYQATLNNHPPANIADACQTVMSKMVANARTQGMPGNSYTSKAHGQYLIEQKQRIFDDAARDANRLRNATLNSITNGDNITGGAASLSLNASDTQRERARELQTQTEKKAQTIMLDAKMRARELR